MRKLEDTWEDVVLLTIEEISFIGQALLARMNFRTRQAKRALFSAAALDPHTFTFGDLSMILVGDFGQLEPIDDWSLCDKEVTYAHCPKYLRHLLQHARYGRDLFGKFTEAVMFNRMNRSQEDHGKLF